MGIDREKFCIRAFLSKDAEVGGDGVSPLGLWVGARVVVEWEVREDKRDVDRENEKGRP